MSPRTPLLSRVTWAGGMAFDAEQDGHVFPLDATAELGGRDHGPCPKGLLLTAVIGCVGMGTISVLQGMRVSIQGLSVEAEGALAAGPSAPYAAICIRFAFAGDPSLDPRRLWRAVTLAAERYCGVIDSLRAEVSLSFAVTLNGVPLPGADD